jgi:hypothetical protein
MKTDTLNEFLWMLAAGGILALLMYLYSISVAPALQRAGLPA